MRSRGSTSICSETSVICQDSSKLTLYLFSGLSKWKCGMGIAAMLRRSGRLLGGTGLVEALAEPQGVKARQVQERQKGRNEQSAHDSDRHRAPEGRARQR